MKAVASSSSVAHTTAGELQSDVTVSDMSISGTLKAIEEWVWDPYSFTNGYIHEGPYHFIALNVSENNYNGLLSAVISQDGAEIDLLHRVDKKVVIEIQDVSKPIVITQSNGIESRTQTFDISELILAVE